MGNSCCQKDHDNHEILQSENVPINHNVQIHSPVQSLSQTNVAVHEPFLYNHESNRPTVSTFYTSDSSTYVTKLQSEELPINREHNPFKIPQLKINTAVVNRPLRYDHLDESNRYPAANLASLNNTGDIETKLLLKDCLKTKEKCNNENRTISTQDNKSTKTTAILPFIILTRDDFMRGWFLWKNEFLTYMKSIDHTERNKQKWGIMLLNRMGPIGQEIYRTFTFDKDHAGDNIDILLKKFDFYCIFGDIKRGNDEEIDKYVNNLKVMVMRHVNTETATEQILKEKIIMDIDKDRFTQKAKSVIPHFSFLSCVQSLTVKEMTYIWMLYENADFKRKEEFIGNNLIKNCSNCGNTHKVKNCPAYGKQCYKCGNINHYDVMCPSQYIVNCFYCGEEHFFRNCPAYANICNKCDKPNHFSWKCLSTEVNCNFCGFKHIASRSKCPAINSICSKCHKSGHFVSKCKSRR